MKVKEMTNQQLIELAHTCGIYVFTKLMYNFKLKKFVFDEHIVEGDLVALRQLLEAAAALENQNEV